MQGEKREHWLDLCMQATEEHDPVKMLALITEINNLLKRQRAGHPYTRGALAAQTVR